MIHEKIRIKQNKIIAARALAVLLMVVLSVAGASVSYGYAAADEADTAPVRQAHRVKVGDRKYCVFVRDNAVLTPEKISKMTDNELIVEILRRSGFFMKQTNCRKSEHKTIDTDGWIKKGCSFMLSPKDIDSIRNARPSDGKPVKLHMDLLISTDPYVEEKKGPDVKADKPAEDKTKQRPAGDEEQKLAGDEEQKPQDEEDQNSADSDGQEPGTHDEQKPEDGASQETGNDGEQKPEDSSGQETGNDGEQKPEDGSGQETGNDGEQKPEDGSGKETETGNEQGLSTSDDKGSGTSEEIQSEKKNRRTYSTYKLLSPELLFVIVATKADASAGEDNCGEGKTAAAGDKSNDSVDSDSGQEMLPEFRTIAMTDRKGPPLEDTLKDGSPVTLTWVEPDKRADSQDQSVLRYLTAAFAGLAVLAAAATVVIVRRRKKRMDLTN